MHYCKYCKILLISVIFSTPYKILNNYWPDSSGSSGSSGSYGCNVVVCSRLNTRTCSAACSSLQSAQHSNLFLGQTPGHRGDLQGSEIENQRK